MNQYPLILIPAAIQQAKLAEPAIPVFNEPLPQPPGTEPSKLSTSVIAAESTAVVIASGIATTQGAIPGLLVFLAGAGAIALHLKQQHQLYQKQKKAHQRAVKEYHLQQEEYRQKRQIYQETIAQLQSQQGIAGYRYQQVLEVLSQTTAPDGVCSRAKKGASEERFGTRLNYYFKDKIQTGLSLKVPGRSYPFTPDFTYSDPELNLYIDIEIDEPYAFRINKPTHYLEASNNKERNDFFVSKGWIVIRFSEEQVVKWSESCCRAVAEVIADVTGDSRGLSKFYDVPTLQPMKRWSKAEAVTMAKNDYRNQYLKRVS